VIELGICPDCYAALVRDAKAISWKYYFEDEKLVDYCVHCGEDTKLILKDSLWACPFTYRSNNKNHSQKSNVLSIQLMCPKCGRTYFSENYLFSRHLIDRSVVHPYFLPDRDKLLFYSKAKFAEQVGRYDDAANFYEKGGYIENAKKIRDTNRVQHHEHKHVTVDVNGLLEILGRTNYTIPYKCPGCGAVIKLNKERSADRFLTCEYCGSSLKAIDIESIIKQLI